MPRKRPAAAEARLDGNCGPSGAGPYRWRFAVGTRSIALEGVTIRTPSVEQTAVEPDATGTAPVALCGQHFQQVPIRVRVINAQSSLNLNGTTAWSISNVSLVLW
jgi:hypothetical protein